MSYLEAKKNMPKSVLIPTRRLKHLKMCLFHFIVGRVMML